MAIYLVKEARALKVIIELEAKLPLVAIAIDNSKLKKDYST